jgi:hypothetical protein
MILADSMLFDSEEIIRGSGEPTGELSSSFTLLFGKALTSNSGLENP